EEEVRMIALKVEEEKKTEKLQEWIDQEIISLSNRVAEVQEKMEIDSVTFLQSKVHSSKSSSGCRSSDWCVQHLGNLRYRVWEKIRDICPYFPMVLDPNTAPADFSVADDLACVRKCAQDWPNPVSHCGNRLVLGSDGYVDVHCWDVEVAESQHWTLGVCQRSDATVSQRMLTPENGFWCLSRDGNSLLGSSETLTMFSFGETSSAL
ncbi:hypothetical protein P4O66_021666, partial [Electrophorus voltai]